MENAMTTSAAGVPAKRHLAPSAEQRPSAGRCICGVTLVDEDELIPIARADERGSSRFARDLIATTSARQRESVVREKLDGIGFEWLGYYTSRRLAAGGASRTFVRTYAPTEWSQQYFEQRYHEVDPRLVRQQRSSLPLVWDLRSIDETIEQQPASPRSRRFQSDLHGSGIGSGIFCRVVTTDSQMVEETAISLVSSEASRRWIDDRVLADALTFALSLRDYLSQRVRIDAPVVNETGDDAAGGGAGNLPPAQQAVLRHVASGLTDREMAHELGISPHAVDYHLRQLRRRFGVRNRVQLVAAAARSIGIAGGPAAVATPATPQGAESCYGNP